MTDDVEDVPDLCGDPVRTHTFGGMGGHHSAFMLKDEWLTPPALLRSLGTFDLDPCSPIKRPWPTATAHYTVEDNGLAKPWHGRVWLNPPYGNQTARWMAKLSAHRNGIALIFARTETAAFFEHVWDKADAILFLKGRLAFHHANGAIAANNSGAPSCLIAYGENNVVALGRSGIEGKLVML